MSNMYKVPNLVQWKSSDSYFSWSNILASNNTCELCTCDLNLEILASCSISLCKKPSKTSKWGRKLTNQEEIRRAMSKRFTFCISALETKDSEMLSRLSLRTSVIAEVIASACLVGTPCDSSFLTCERHDHPGEQAHPHQQLDGAFRRTPLGHWRKPKRNGSKIGDPGG